MQKTLKKIAVSILTAVTLGSFLPSVPSVGADAADEIRVMPLGDSITFGMADEGGYRKYLSYFLKQNGYDNIDLVGPEGSNSASFTYNGQQVTYDDNHAGYSGYTITDLPGGWFGQLNGILETMQKGDYIKKYSPDVILLQIGTNDVSNGHLDGSEERLHTLLDYLLENMPQGGTVFMTTIPDLGNLFGGNTNADVAEYNKLIKKVADEYSSNNKNIVYADIHSVIDASKDLADGVHPNSGGYEKMGKYWFDTLDKFFKSSNSTGNVQNNTQPTEPVDQPTNNEPNDQPNSFDPNSKTVKIMPLGDSITFGMADEGGYRKYLSYFLKQNGYDNIDLVGPEGSNSASFTYNGQQVTYDDNHAGYSGYTITDLPGGWFGQLNGILETMQKGDYIKKYSPDVILLQIGTNDVSNGHLDGSEERLHTLLDYLLENMPQGGTVFMTTIPDLGNLFGGNTNADVAEYNKLIKKVADEYSSNNKNIVYADIHSVIDASKDLADGVHPNSGGYEKMGKYWFDTLDKFFKSSSPQEPDYLLGDVNSDGRISVFDIAAFRSGLVSGFSDETASKAADIDGNGTPEMSDLVQLCKFLMCETKELGK